MDGARSKTRGERETTEPDTRTVHERDLDDSREIEESGRPVGSGVEARARAEQRLASPTSTSPEGRPFPPEAAEAHIHSGASSGAQSSQEDWVRANASPEENDGRSLTRTMFRASDAKEHSPGQQHLAPSDRTSWSTLAKRNDGVGSDISRGGQNWKADKKRWVDAFADELNASPYHKRHAQYIIERLDLSHYKAARISTEKVIVGVLSLLIDADITDFENRTLNRPGAMELLDSLEMSVGEYTDIRQKLRDRSKELLFPEH